MENSLEIVKGSHPGSIYAAAGITAYNPGAAVHGSMQGDAAGKDGTAWSRNQEGERTRMPRIPDIKNEREKWEFCSFPVKRGDVIMMHPACIHGGGPVSAASSERNTLALRFFGDGCRYCSLPRFPGTAGYRDVKDGDHLSLSGSFYPDGGWNLLLGPGLAADTGKAAKL